MKLSINLVLFLTLLSCSSGVKLNSKFCRSANGVWADMDEKLEYSASKRVLGIGIKEEKLRNIFESRSIDCRDVSRMRVVIEQGFFDSLLSLIPGYSSNTVTIEFNLEDS